jgi:hypothetical protein
LPVEAEDVLQSRPVLSGQRRAQARTCAVQAYAHVLLAQLQYVGHLGRGHPFDVAQQHDRPVPGLEAIDGVLDSTGQRLEVELLFWHELRGAGRGRL